MTEERRQGKRRQDDEDYWRPVLEHIDSTFGTVDARLISHKAELIEKIEEAKTIFHEHAGPKDSVHTKLEDRIKSIEASVTKGYAIVAGIGIGAAAAGRGAYDYFTSLFKGHG